VNGAPDDTPATSAELADAVYLQDYSAAAGVLALLHGIAWRALEQELGADVALELAPDLLPPLVQSAQREAMARQLEREHVREQLAQQQFAQQRMVRPPHPENPW